MSLNLGLVAIEALVLGGVAVALHASSHRYGLAPMLVFLTGLVAVLHTSGANAIFVDAWGLRVVVTDSVIVPVILASVLMRSCSPRATRWMPCPTSPSYLGTSRC